jgi:Na+-transporting NADH:ubiquinone oxidoreductase subunit C
MDVNKNSYTFTFSALLVIVVGTALAFAAEGLKPMQKENVRLEKMQNILASVKVEATPEEAGEKFEQYIIEQVMLDNEGNIVVSEGKTAFDIDVVKEFKTLDIEKRNYPLFVFEDNGARKYIVPMAGNGLWGPIWGFVAFEGDMNTIYGSTFDHKTETPGLGAEINQAEFQDKFIGKTIFDGTQYVSVEVVKGGADVEGESHMVDGISGGTITSKGVSEMMQRTLNVYVPYFKGNQKAAL